MNPRYEKMIMNKISANSNMLVPFYLMCSYAYYEEDNPIVSDAFYDKLARKLLKEYDDIDHRHKDLIDKDALEAGSFLGKYPSIVQGALQAFRNSIR